MLSYWLWGGGISINVGWSEPSCWILNSQWGSSLTIPLIFDRGPRLVHPNHSFRTLLSTWNETCSSITVISVMFTIRLELNRRKYDMPSNLNWIEENMVCFQILIELNFCICLLNSIQPLTWHLLKWYSGMSFSMWAMVGWTEQFGWKRGGSHHQERGALILRLLVELNWEMRILCRASYRDFSMD